MSKDCALVLAKECGINCDTTGKFWLMREDSLEAFYRAAFNAGIEDAAKKFDGKIFAYDYRELAAAIRALEMKP